MSESIRYPESGLYQKYKPEIEIFSKKFEPIADNPEDAIVAYFQLPREQLDTVTAREKEDVSNFARYAGKKLAIASLHAPLFEKSVSRGRSGAQYAMHQGARRSYHDVLHAMFAYNQANGESITPAYLKVLNKSAQFTDPASIQEEVMVLLWQGNEDFMQRVFHGEDPLAVMEKTFVRDVPLAKSRMRELAPLKTVSPLEYYLGIHEAYCLGILWLVAGDKKMEADLVRGFDAMARSRSEEYVHIAELLHENSQSENPDSKILLHEFQRILKPLLQGLRVKNESQGITVESVEH